MTAIIPTEAQARLILQATPVSLVATASQAGDSKTGIPNQKLVAGGVSGVAALIICVLLQKYAGITLPIDIVAPIVGALFVAFVPPSQRDIVNHMTDEIVHAAQRDPDSNVSSVLAPTLPKPGQPAMITPPAPKTI